MKNAYTLCTKAKHKAENQMRRAIIAGIRQGIADEKTRQADPERPMTDAEKLYQEFKEFAAKRREQEASNGNDA